MLTVNKLIQKAQDLGWSVEIDRRDGTASFTECSNAGQDFSMTLNCKTAIGLIEDLERFLDNFDPFYEAYMWVGSDGHGMNGAPDDPRDIIDDMEDCQGDMEDLLVAWHELKYDEEQ